MITKVVLWRMSMVLAALAASTGAQAQEPCNIGSLKGQYVFVGRGFIEAAEPGVQLCITASSFLMARASSLESSQRRQNWPRKTARDLHA